MSSNRRTISAPTELFKLADQSKEKLNYATFSNYIQALIRRDTTNGDHSSMKSASLPAKAMRKRSVNLTLDAGILKWANQIMDARRFGSLVGLVEELIREEYERRKGPVFINSSTPELGHATTSTAGADVIDGADKDAIVSARVSRVLKRLLADEMLQTGEAEAVVIRAALNEYFASRQQTQNNITGNTPNASY